MGYEILTVLLPSTTLTGMQMNRQPRQCCYTTTMSARTASTTTCYYRQEELLMPSISDLAKRIYITLLAILKLLLPLVLPLVLNTQ
jgi:hypothetical protein